MRRELRFKWLTTCILGCLRVQPLRKLASLPRNVTPLPVEAAPMGLTSLVPSSDDADGENCHVDNDDDDDDDDHVGGVDDDASHHDEQSSPQAPRDSGSQHGRNGSSNLSLTSPAPEPHDDSGEAQSKRTRTIQHPRASSSLFFPPLLSGAQRRSS